ncbi:uncharacterized protein LOC106474534 isoform X2 [Limulus polyphemus]|uniref:Uncharacterized protein LOC106474534 isoform X2 n=1 Tax=Limulus polyphemus TaxID=6850 RepID=A0ABM1TRR1_LIMPO|nr:uncharacterized protein LOC106474534 isoform X2 [Limulus polyphemus]
MIRINSRRPSSWAGNSELDAAPSRRPSGKRLKVNSAMCTCGKRRHDEEKYDTSDTCTGDEELGKNSRSPELFQKTSFYFSCLRRKKTSDDKK